MERLRKTKEVLDLRRCTSSHSRSWLGIWLVVIAASGLTGCQHLKTGAATTGIVAATSALVPGAIVAPAVLGGVTAATVSALTAVPQHRRLRSMLILLFKKLRQTSLVCYNSLWRWVDGY